MGLATNLKLTATKLIKDYGNTVTITTTSTDGTYNPLTGEEGSPVEVSHIKQAYIAPVTNEELVKSGLPEDEWGKITFIATFIEDDETELLDNSWNVNGTRISKVLKTTSQDITVVLKVYCG